jgi:hypothetical protein
MTQKLITVALASAFAITSGIAFAAGPNDAFKYPNAESHKNYTDQRIADHNNAAPRYPVTSSNKPYSDKRIMDHNNAAPRYSATTKQQTAGSQAATTNSPRYTVRSTQRRVVSGNPG